LFINVEISDPMALNIEQNANRRARSGEYKNNKKKNQEIIKSPGLSVSTAVMVLKKCRSYTGTLSVEPRERKRERENRRSESAERYVHPVCQQFPSFNALMLFPGRS